MRIGLDVGGTKTLAVALDDDDRVVASERRPTGWGADAVVDGIVRSVEALAGTAPVRSIGIGIPGQIATGSGRVRHALNLGIDDLDLAARVAGRLGVVPAVDNDVRAAALGAFALRSGSSARADAGRGVLAYLNLGTGVAAGIVAGGRPWRGGQGAAGEIGHISVDPAGPACTCGQRGCIEALAGGGAIAARWGRPGLLPVRDVMDAADAGDAAAQLLRSDLHRGVASAVQLLILTADPDFVVLGGGVAGLGDRLLEPVQSLLAASSASSAFLRSLRWEERVTLMPAGSPVGAVGAALLPSRSPAPVGAPFALAPPEVAAHG